MVIPLRCLTAEVATPANARRGPTPRTRITSGGIMYALLQIKRARSSNVHLLLSAFDALLFKGLPSVATPPAFLFS